MTGLLRPKSSEIGIFFLFFFGMILVVCLGYIRDFSSGSSFFFLRISFWERS